MQAVVKSEAAAGAEVIKIESQAHLDLTRRLPLYPPDVEPGVNRCPLFNQWSQGKKSLLLNLTKPEGVALDTLGNVYVADTWNHTIRKITIAGLVTTFAGTPGVSGTNDATGSSARFFEPSGVAVDKLGTLYVADSGNHTIRRCTAAASVSTLAGSALNYGSVDGLGTGALFHSPQSVAVDGSGYVYVADFWNQTIRQVSPGGAVVTITGLATNRGSADGLNANARFWAPAGVAVPSPKDYTL